MRVASYHRGGSAQCIARAVAQVPLPGHITEQLQQLKEYQDKDKAVKK